MFSNSQRILNNLLETTKVALDNPLLTDGLTFQASEVDRKIEEASALREQEDALATVLSAREFHR